MSFIDTSCGDFTAALAAKVSVPGGGGASALAGAVGVALGTMVGNFTVGKKKYAEVEPRILELMDEAEKVRLELLALMDKDAEAFEPLSKAYGIPKDEPGRDEIMEKCLRDAAAVPLAIMELCCKAVVLHKEFAEKGSTLMVSDAGTGAAICLGAIKGAALNVKVNTKLMADKEYAAKLNARVDELMAAHAGMADEIYNTVMARF